MKYIMYEDETFVIFSEKIRHKDIECTKVIKSAGFVEVKLVEEKPYFICSGYSHSLNKSCDKEEDEFIINLSFDL